MTVLMFKVKENKPLCYIKKTIRFKVLDNWKMKKVINQLITKKMKSRRTKLEARKCTAKQTDKQSTTQNGKQITNRQHSVMKKGRQ